MGTKGNTAHKQNILCNSQFFYKERPKLSTTARRQKGAEQKKNKKHVNYYQSGQQDNWHTASFSDRHCTIDNCCRMCSPSWTLLTTHFKKNLFFSFL